MWSHRQFTLIISESFAGNLLRSTSAADGSLSNPSRLGRGSRSRRHLTSDAEGAIWDLVGGQCLRAGPRGRRGACSGSMLDRGSLRGHALAARTGGRCHHGGGSGIRRTVRRTPHGQVLIARRPHRESLAVASRPGGAPRRRNACLLVTGRGSAGLLPILSFPHSSIGRCAGSLHEEVPSCAALIG